MKSKILIGLLIIILAVLAFGCGKDKIESEPVLAEEVTTEPQPAIPVDDEGVQDVDSEMPEDVVDAEDEELAVEDVAELEVEDETSDDEGVTEVSEDLDEDKGLTAENYRVVSLKDLKAYPSVMEINIGTTVEWRNVNDRFQHIIGWRDQTNMGVKPEPILQGESWSYTFQEPGEVEWFSTARPTIQGKITVIDPDAEEADEPVDPDEV